MLVKLIHTLIERKCITPDTEIEAKYTSLGMDSLPVHVQGDFIIRSTRMRPDGSLIFEACRTTDGKVVKINPENIVKIDGMIPTRFAHIYGLKPDGTSRKSENKRGRKPKNKVDTEYFS